MENSLRSKFSRLLFGGQLENAPPDVDTIPCTGVDLSAHKLVVTFGLIVDQRLDPAKLETALFRLVEHKFRKAGARLGFRNGVSIYLFITTHSIHVYICLICLNALDPEI